jgi:hypothetical protein
MKIEVHREKLLKISTTNIEQTEKGIKIKERGNLVNLI